jgi:hypothetical protein
MIHLEGMAMLHDQSMSSDSDAAAAACWNL